MPHQIIEYSANLDLILNMQDIVDGMHDLASNIDGLPIAGLRTRACRRDYYRIADKHSDNSFIHVILKLGHGRSTDIKKQFGEKLFIKLCKLLEPISSDAPIAISFEIQEIDSKLTWKKNNIREFINKRIL